MQEKKDTNIGIVGYGFVGKAIEYGFRETNLVIADPNLGTSTQTLIDSGLDFDAIFIAVPTPMGEDGKINSSIVEKVIAELADMPTLLVLKSTVLPDIVDRLEWQYPNFVYNPEFLTEKNAKQDFVNPMMHVMGGSHKNCEKLLDIYHSSSECRNPPLWEDKIPVYFMSAKEASFVKYTMNSYLTTKVLFFNQIYQLCQKHGARYDQVIKAVGTDPRIGRGHTNVPGHDGRFGAGSACFSKDVPAFTHFSELDLNILREVWNTNVDIRNSYGDVLEREKEQHIEFKKI
jgi:UDPglucose 6-dehydrogenase